jgi:trimeric autotransporter adhesin
MDAISFRVHILKDRLIQKSANQNPTMKIKLHSLLILLAYLTGIHQAAAQGTAFTYQGKLDTNGLPATGSFDFRFKLFPNPLGNLPQVGTTFLTNGIPVAGGLFTAGVDFGPGIFTGSNYWLLVGVRTNGGSTYTDLSPLQPLTPTPYAITANSASNLLGNLPATQLAGPVLSANLSGTYGNVVTLNNANDTFTGVFSGNGSGLTNVWQTGGNTGANPANGAFLGTTDNNPLELRVDGSRALRLEPGVAGDGAPNVIGGSPVNFVSSGVKGATIGGGGAVNDDGAATNSVTADYGTVAGGAQNTAGNFSLVGGGFQNSASNVVAVVAGGYDNTNNGYGSAIGGGQGNLITSNYATIDGGLVNTNTGFGSTIGGGQGNLTTNSYATVGGGFMNLAGAFGATVAGGQGNTNNGGYATVGGGLVNLTGAFGATVAGGQGNTNNGGYATVGGGFVNTATGLAATIGGGVLNQATTNYATVPGGSNNVASGVSSFAAGNNAQATNQGAFVWADSQAGVFSSTNNDSFNIRARGGVHFVTSGAGLTVDGPLSGNGGGLTNIPAAQVVGGANSNLFLGANAGNLTMTGNQNLGVGQGSLSNNTTGIDNVGAGFEALALNTSGSVNTAFGVDALASNSKGNDNTAMGASALAENTTASDNTGLGFSALAANSTGSNNTAVGSSSLSESTSGSHNTAVGFNSLFVLETGNQNTAIGESALNNLGGILGSGGSANIALGYQAGLSLRTGSSNIYIGSDAANTTENNTIRIGTPGIQTSAVIAGTITGNGGGLTNLGAAQLTGTLPATLAMPAISATTTDIISAGAIGNLLLFGNNTQNFYGGGAGALTTTGSDNTAFGSGAFHKTAGGSDNTVFGAGALFNNASGSGNTAIGDDALTSSSTGSSNIAVGINAGSAFTGSESSNIDIGSQGVAGDASTTRIGSAQTKTFIAGISGVTVSGGAAVSVLPNGQLGTVTSSARFKTNIQSMADASDVLLSLHPVTFKYKPELDPQGIPQFGLVAEEVAKADPDLVLRDEQGKIYTVRYEAVNAMLLNEFLKQHHRVEEQNAEIETLQQKAAKVDSLEKRLNELEQTVQSLVPKK